MNNDIKKLIDDNWGEIKEFIIKKAEQKTKTIWNFNTNDKGSYYYIDEDGYLRQDWFDEGCFEIRRDLGNAFLTKEEAEFELERQKIEAIMKKYSFPFENGKQNYFIYYDPCNKVVVTTWWRDADYGIYHFKTREIAQQVINEIGEDRLKKYWFRVVE